MAVSKPARTFQDLLVWQKAHPFVLEVYTFTVGFPKQESYGLSLQMRRAAVSIAANIAEGFRRRSQADKARFMNQSKHRLSWAARDRQDDDPILGVGIGVGRTP